LPDGSHLTCMLFALWRKPPPRPYNLCVLVCTMQCIEDARIVQEQTEQEKAELLKRAEVRTGRSNPFLLSSA
jgi:hypothetical protein